MATEVQVDPAVLEAMARVAGDLQAAVRTDVTDVEPETAAAARALTGWQTGRAIEALMWWWRDDLTRLSGRLGVISDGLMLCARDYRYSDQASAQNFRLLG